MYKKYLVPVLLLAVSLMMVVGCDKDSPNKPEPINEFNLPCHATENYKYDQSSCWNDLNKVFICPDSSYIYQYQSQNNGTNYKIYANMEYRGTGSWNNNNTCEDYYISDQKIYNSFNKINF